MIAWWSDLSGPNQTFYLLAGFFSAIFLWQFISSLIGLAGGEMDVDVDLDVDDIEAGSMGDAAETVAAFKFLSIRAVLAFCMLFCWAMAMYLNVGKPLERAMLYAAGWGIAGWVAVSVLVNWMRKLAETGTARLSSAVGTTGSVYLDISAGGTGEVRVTVGGAVTMVKARTAGDGEIPAGTPIRVVRKLDNTTVEVEPIDPDEHRREGKQ